MSKVRSTLQSASLHQHGQKGKPRSTGFTLIELLLGLVVTSILVGLLLPVLAYPAKHITAQARRAELNQQAALIAHWFAYDVKRALPNSVRVSADGTRLELLATVDEARYRSTPGTNPPGLLNNTHIFLDDILDPVFFDGSFNITGRLLGDYAVHGSPLPAGYQLALYGEDIDDIYDSAVNGGEQGLLTDRTNTIDLVDDGDEDQFKPQRPHRFRFLPLASEKQRIYVVESAVLYRCNGQRLERHVNYQPEEPIANPPAASEVAELSDQLSKCGFSYTFRPPPDCGNPVIAITVPLCQLPAGQREVFDWGSASITAELRDGNEKLILAKQAHVDNAP